MFWYCTLAEALEELTGAPVAGMNFRHSEAGTIFTKQQPHEIGSVESAMFPTELREAVLAWSLSHQLLQRLPAPLSNSSLRIVPGKVLIALRGSDRILRSCRILSHGTEEKYCFLHSASFEPTNCWKTKIHFYFDKKLMNHKTRLVAVQTVVGAYLAKAMSRIRIECPFRPGTHLYVTLLGKVTRFCS
jgi:hypothetical protein